MFKNIIFIKIKMFLFECFQTLCSYTQTLWAAFLRHEHISKNSHILDILPELVSGAKTLLLKVFTKSIMKANILKKY